MKVPQLVTTGLLSLSESTREECRLAILPNKTPAEMARLRQLQAENALKAAGPDETKPRAHGRTNFKDL
jgi:uncharacterized protein YciI